MSNAVSCSDLEPRSVGSGEEGKKRREPRGGEVQPERGGGSNQEAAQELRLRGSNRGTGAPAADGAHKHGLTETALNWKDLGCAMTSPARVHGAGRGQ